jgi:ribosomal protein S2
MIIPANDDAIRSVRLLTAGIADAAIHGMMRHEIGQAEVAMDVESNDTDPASTEYSPDVEEIEVAASSAEPTAGVG